MLRDFTHMVISSFSYLTWKFAGEKSEACEDETGERQSWASNLGPSDFTVLWSQRSSRSFKQTALPSGCLCEVLDGRDLIRFLDPFSTAPSTGRGAWWGAPRNVQRSHGGWVMIGSISKYTSRCYIIIPL